ncbi:hypothetical protein [Bacillus sp. T33-2]|uniref:hypothetical protein n=1 Tax=Bacillus sp. T33-2 TaxID=2054168 RepID=UPI000C76F476|nr:hypothetical protein [Bacillus sp. T33-2]PLR96920.1 hypothetical protein CVD19_10050 [Bacillus sp. T33-2]
MGKKQAAFFSIFLFLVINIVSLSNVIEGFYGEEYGHVYTFMSLALLSTVLATIAYLIWKKQEYRKKQK